MSDHATYTLPEAARRLAVPARALRHAIRAGLVPKPPSHAATAALSAEWLASVQAALETSPKLLHAAIKQKVPPFARYEGTSAWRKYPNRVREYAHFRAATGSAPRAVAQD